MPEIWAKLEEQSFKFWLKFPVRGSVPVIFISLFRISVPRDMTKMFERTLSDPISRRSCDEMRDVTARHVLHSEFGRHWVSWEKVFYFLYTNMPVASLRSNQVASNDNMDSTKALIGMIDKKVRNLEKRKVGIFCNHHPWLVSYCMLNLDAPVLYLTALLFNKLSHYYLELF
jgi:hypothetical protein